MQCPKCRAVADENTKYCKICAFDLTKADFSANRTPPNFTGNSSQPEQISNGEFIQSEFAANNSQLPVTELFTTETPNTFPLKKSVFIGGVLLASFSFITIVLAIFFMNSKNEVAASIPSTNKNVPSNSYRANSTNYLSSPPSASSKTGRLTTDLNVRDAPNKEAYSLGIHFKDAKVRVLEETSYELDGTVSTWYLIRVIETGCSVDANLGCGKNSPSDSDEGWVNAKYILLN